MNNICKCNLLKKKLTSLKIDKNNETESAYKELLENSLEGIKKLSEMKKIIPVE